MSNKTESCFAIPWQVAPGSRSRAYEAEFQNSRLAIWRIPDGYELEINGVKRCTAGLLANVEAAAAEFMARKINGTLTPEERLEEAQHLLRRALARITNFGPSNDKVANLIRLYFGERPVS